MHFYYKTMVNNISNFGVINFFESNSTKQESASKAQPACEDVEPEEPTVMPPKFFCISEKFPEQNIRDRLAADLAQSTTKIEYCRALYRLQHMGCIDISQYASDEKRANVFNEYQSKFKLSASDFCKARASIQTQN